MVTSRRLLLMRHAKSDRANWRGPDHDRPLNDRGKRSAEEVGRHLAAAGRHPDRIVTSTALRARATAELVTAAAGWAVPIELDQRLYGAGPMELIGAIRELADQTRQVLLVGHEPTWSMVASGLTGDGYIEMPTAAVAVISFEVPWPAVAWESGRLVDHILARPLIEGT